MDDARRRKYFSLARELQALGARPEAAAIERAATLGDGDAWRRTPEGAAVWAYAEGALDATLVHAQHLPHTVRAAGLRGLDALTSLEMPRPALRLVQGGAQGRTPPRAA